MSNEQLPPEGKLEEKSKNRAIQRPKTKKTPWGFIARHKWLIIFLIMAATLACYVWKPMYHMYIIKSYEAASQQALQSFALAQGAHQVDHQHYLATGTKSDYEGLTKYELQKDLNLNYGRIYADDVDGQPGFYFQVNHRSGGRSWFWASRDPGVKPVTEEAVAKYPGLNINGVKPCTPPSWWDKILGRDLNMGENDHQKSESVWCD